LSILLFNLQKTLNHRLAVGGITAILAIYVLWQAGSLVWKVWLLDKESPQADGFSASSLVTSEPESLQDLLRYPLIRSESESTAENADSNDQPMTTLDLKLVGLMYSTDKNQARAIIENPQDGARSYSTHERVAEKAEIYSIEPDRVILLHAGRQEALLLDPEKETSSPQQESGSLPAGGPDQNQASAQVSEAIPRKTEDVMREFSATPVMDGGKLVGFHLTAVQNPQIMSEWGIAPDDVITAVNGVPLNSQGKIMVLYDKLKKQREFELTVNSGGNSRTITVDLNE